MKKKIDKKNNKNFALIISTIILSAVIYTIYYNSSGATLTRECKKMVNSIKWAEGSEVQGKAYVMSRCLNGQPLS